MPQPEPDGEGRSAMADGEGRSAMADGEGRRGSTVPLDMDEFAEYRSLEHDARGKQITERTLSELAASSSRRSSNTGIDAAFLG